jgi:2-C-methyl-D-erythritol 4-phosphate cytidylyltransferase
MKQQDLQNVAEAIADYLPESYTSAIILAAGSSTRMGEINKQLYQLNGIPVLAHTMLAYQKCPMIKEIVVVTRKDDFDAVLEMRKKYGITKLKHLVTGGKTRQESARRGMTKLSAESKYVAIVDGARCLTTPAQISKVCLMAYHYKAACAAHLVEDTMKRATVAGAVRETVDRTNLWQAQTPQVFSTALYRAALVKAETDKFTATDDSALIEHLGYRVRLVECGRSNIKITTPMDLPMAQAILDYRNRE